MNLNEIITKRQSIRKYKEDVVPKEAIVEMLEAASAAPSGKNMQNWHYVVINKKEAINKIKECVYNKNEEISKKMEAIDQEKADRFRKFAKNFTLFFANAPTIVLVFTETYYPSGYNEMALYGESESKLNKLIALSPGMQSLGASIEHFILKATELGYGTCWLTSANYAADEIEAYLKDSNIFEKENYYMAALLSIGVPEGDPKSPSRRSPEENYTWVE